MRTGVIRNLPNATYHGGDGDSKSTLDIVHHAPVKLRAYRAGKIERKPTAAQALGTAFHCLLLEPEVFATEYALPFEAPADALDTMDDMKKALTAAGVTFKSATNKGGLIDLVREHLPGACILGDAIAAHAKQNEGRTIITAEEWENLHRMRDAVMAHGAARALISAPGESELSCYWLQPVIDPDTGEHMQDENGELAYLQMRCRPDFWRHDGIIVDIKTTASEHGLAEEFARSVYKWRYHVQHPLYLKGARDALNAERAKGEANEFHQFSTPREFVFLAVENDAQVIDGVAMGVAVYRLCDDSVQLGHEEMTGDVMRLWECYQSGKWPGYSERVEPLSLPGYVFARAAQARAGA